MRKGILTLGIVALGLMGPLAAIAQNNYGKDLNFLKKHKDVIELKSDDGKSRVAIVADYQGRVMTSSAEGESGNSYGWLNYKLIESGEIQKHINALGGEDRFWLGPEGGQYAIFFKPGTRFVFEDWFTPASLDTEAFDVAFSKKDEAEFTRTIALQNYSGTDLKVDIRRNIKVYSKKEVEKNLRVKIGDKVSFVGYRSENTMKNVSGFDWKKDKGLLSIWILGMYNPSDRTNVVVPLKGKNPIVNSDYFGAVSPDRLTTKGKIAYFKGDGKSRGKIGVAPANTKPILGSYSADKGILTIVKFSFHNEKDYVNSQWKHQEHPYGGDVINSYNDGPVSEDGSQLGPFYELETSSSARELKNNESITHTHMTFHFEGDKTQLNKISKKLLGASLEEIENAL
ncbi:hypothetical protein FUAX_52360 (plasmid) [Fulvitalea axinellae]|uniref:Uncharacterized protein n=1 Tax=Fulvitalea axinellae TaxID=1182444 RepID=A0AAU9D2J4_9BACT|nr:hypothetical protein FUAX_52360 [Fulvitalea axinellae]